MASYDRIIAKSYNYDKKIMRSLLIDPRFMEHLTGYGHPESPRRIETIMQAISQDPSLQHLIINPFPLRLATEEEILLCHTKSYYDLVQREVQELSDPMGNSMLSTGDVTICPSSFEIARLAVGSTLNSVDYVLTGQDRHIFCAVRPPGHHACSNKGMGFCLFNNIAIAARFAKKQAPNLIRKILIVDWDVHHGNGTQEIFDQDPSVFYFSTHQGNHYPGTGSEKERGIGAGKGTILNCPILAGTSSRQEVLKTFQDKLIPAMKVFQPSLVLISAGFDGHTLDPLGGFNLESEDFATLTEIVLEIANTYASGRVISLLEGGYNLNALAESVVAHLKALA